MAPTDTDTDALPVPAETARPYIRLQLTDAAPLAPETVTAQCRRLHRLLTPESTGWRAPPPPTLELALVAEPGEPLAYYIGIDDPELIDTLEHILRGLFPNRYEFDRITQAPTWLDALRQVPTSPTEDRADTAREDDAAVAAITFQGTGAHHLDWQTQLTPFAEFMDDDHARVPLASVVEVMADSEGPMVYQALLRAKPNWSRRAEDRRCSIEANQDTITGQVWNVIAGPPDDPASSLPLADEARLKELRAKDTRHTFEVAARAVAIGEDTDHATRAIEALTTAFADMSRTNYTVTNRVASDTAGERIFEAMRDRTFPTRSMRQRLPVTRRSRPTLVADAAEVGSFWLLDSEALTDTSARALGTTPGERASLPRPPRDQLRAYHGAGLVLGRPLTADGQFDPDELVLPPALQPLHVVWFGKTGSGKSTALINAILANHEATEGADILIDPKGDGMPIEYLRAHYARHGTLANVRYFDCRTVVPALSFFDIRPDLEAGIDRETAVADVVDHYIEVLAGIMGTERFERAVRSPDVIRYVAKALFDPVHGSDAFTHRDIQRVVREMHETGEAPPVVDEDLELALEGVVANGTRSFEEVLQGAANRIEKLALDDRLAHLFNHVSEADGDGPQFDFYDVLDEDVVILIDTGGLRTETRQAITLVLLSNLWTALRRRARETTDETTPPLVNLYLEEAASVAPSGLMTDLLAQSRGFGLSMTLAMQFPAQLRTAAPDAYAELLNNVSTLVTGNVAVDAELERRLATDEMDARAVGNKLRALTRGQWLVSLPAAFGQPEPRPFLVESTALPPGHPDGTAPLTTQDAETFETLCALAQTRTQETNGLAVETFNDHATGDTSAPTGKSEPGRQPATGTVAGRDAPRVDSALPYTERFPDGIAYDAAAHAVVCEHCDRRYDATLTGLLDAVACCYGLDRLDRDDVPICELPLKLTPAERAASPYSDRQLCFLQAVYTAQQGRYDPEWEYDLRWDSMVRLREYVGIEREAVQTLLSDGMLRTDCTKPHRIYTVTAAGRKAIKASYREGIDYGPGKGDLGESSLHVMMVALGREYLDRAFVADPDSAAVETVTYHQTDHGQLDAACLDEAGSVVVTLEAERGNNDMLRAAPSDYDKMAAEAPEAAIWIVKNREGAHDVLTALNDPPEGPVRVKKTYSTNSPPQTFRIHEPGLTEMYTLKYFRDTVLELQAP